MPPPVMDVSTDNIWYVLHVGGPLDAVPQAKNSSHSVDNIAPAVCDKCNSPKPLFDNHDTNVNTGSPHHPAPNDGSTDRNKKKQQYKWNWEQNKKSSNAIT
eukprot:6633780-Ditylum_brightwellii.AAC.1